MIDIAVVGDILREAASTIIEPRFARLRDDEISEKAPGEVVTVADQEAETFITRHLRELLPGVPVVGEEAVSEDPGLIHALTSAPLAWLVDPLDGTANFTHGDDRWAVMAALVQDGETIASAIYRHTDHRLYLAERGNGACCNGVRLSAPAPANVSAGDLRGAVLTRFLTVDERTTMLPRLARIGEVTAGFNCAGYEYPTIADGEENFALFQRTLPWDHAPGALLLTEAGGVARHPDGSTYRPDTPRRGLLLASSPHVWTCIRDVLYPDQT